MSREERRKQERAQRQIGREERLYASRRLRSDIRRDGIFDAQTAEQNEQYMNLVLAQRLERAKQMARNGITEEDLKKAYDDGYHASRKELTRFAMQMFYSAAALALHRLHGFGEKRIYRVLDAIQQTMVEEITTCDILARCKRETGVEIAANEYDS